MRTLAATAALILAWSPLQAGPEDLSLMQRIERLERMAGSGAAQPGADATRADLVLRLQELRLEMSRLRGEVEMQSHRLKQLERRQRELYMDLDRRLSRMSESAPTAGEAPQAQAPEPVEERPATLPQAPTQPPADEAAPQESRPAAAPRDPARERARYEAAFELLNQGRYQEAGEAFGALLEDYPDGAYADNARYWLGETAYVQRDFDKALAELRQLVDEHPVSPKVPDALLKIGFVHYELEQWSEAREALEEVVGRFPTSTAAQLAEQRLRRMSREGH